MSFDVIVAIATVYSAVRLVDLGYCVMKDRPPVVRGDDGRVRAAPRIRNQSNWRVPWN